MAGRKLRVGVVGTGGIATAQHLPGWLEADCEIVALADVSKDAVRAAAEKFDVPRTFTRPASLMAMDEIDVVDVCTPSALHGRTALKALEAGKHVYIEKPMTTTAPEAHALLKAAKKAKRKLMCGQQQRFGNEATVLKRFMTSPAMGDVYYVRTQYMRRRALPGRPGFYLKKLAGGGALFDIGVHVLDLSWWMLGCPKPISVTAHVGTMLADKKVANSWGTWDRKKIDVDDFAVAFVRFAGGTVLTLEVSWLANIKKTFSQINFLGTKAGARYPELEVYGEAYGSLTDTTLAPMPAKPVEHAHREAIRQFADAVRKDQPVPVPPEQTLQVVEMLDAMYASSKAGKEVRLK